MENFSTTVVPKKLPHIPQTPKPHTTNWIRNHAMLKFSYTAHRWFTGTHDFVAICLSADISHQHR